MKTILVVPDLHGQEKDEVAWRICLRVAKWLEPNICVVLGDFMDSESVSTHPRNSCRPPNLGEDYAVANQDLDALDSALPAICKKHFIEGNHEDRITRFLRNQAPELDGALLLPREALRLNERGWKWIPYGETLTIGKMIFVHGWYTIKFHAARHTDRLGDSVFYGHTHQFQAFQTFHGSNAHLGMNLGCLCKVNPKWLRGKPNDWALGFGIIYFDEKTGEFWPQFVPIINGRAVILGKIFGTRRAA